MTHYRPKLFCLIIIIFLVNFALGIPAANASIFSTSTEDEIKIGREAAREIEKRYGLTKDAELQERVAEIGRRIVEGCGRKDLPYTFKVLDVKDINAFALPGGFIYVNKGLIDYLGTDAELAGVIGHEVAHVNKRHVIHRIEKAQGLTILSMLLFQDKAIYVQGLVLNAIMAGNSRADEKEADHLGFINIMQAGYNPYSLLVGLQRLSDKDDSANFDLFSDHPDTSLRISLQLGYIAQSKISPQVNNDANTATIVAPGLSLPPLYATYQGYKPLYRAELAAGELYLLTKLPNFSGDRFITDSDGIFNTIYYEDRKIIVLTPQDANANKMTLDELTEHYILALKKWSDTVSHSQ